MDIRQCYGCGKTLENTYSCLTPESEWLCIKCLLSYLGLEPVFSN